MEADNFMASVRAGDPVALGLGQYRFLNDRPPCASLEGYLFPDTYRIPAKAEPADLLGAMLDNFEQKAPADLSAAAAQSGFSLWQAVTLASIVEREAVQADERPLIASVYRNRLTGVCDADVGGAYLQADPTVQYAAWPARQLVVETNLDRGISVCSKSVQHLLEPRPASWPHCQPWHLIAGCSRASSRDPVLFLCRHG